MCTTQNAPDDISGQSHRHKKWPPELLGRVNRNELGITDWQINGPAAELAQDPPGTGNEIQSEWIYKVLLDAHLRVYCWIASELNRLTYCYLMERVLLQYTSATAGHRMATNLNTGLELARTDSIASVITLIASAAKAAVLSYCGEHRGLICKAGTSGIRRNIKPLR